MNRKINFPISKQGLIFVLLVSVFVSAIIGFVAGGAGFELSRYINQNKFLKSFISGSSVVSEDQDPEYRSDSVFARDKQIAKIVKDSSPAVVSIIVSKDLPKIEERMINLFENSPLKDFFNFETPQNTDQGTEKQEIGGGTGFIVGENGLILTNRHVVSDEEAEYTVLTSNSEKHDAKIVAIDPIKDLAFLRVEDLNIEPLKLGDSDKIEIGQTAITIGNSLGEFSNTVSVGVISGLRRTVVAFEGWIGDSEELDQVIQTDAAINEGNSGGPLLNLHGEVIGVNTAMAIDAENIAFAIPINEAKRNIKDVIASGQINYPYLGVRYILINKLIQEENQLTVDYGALVIRGDEEAKIAVIPGSPANKADILENDIILEVDGKKISEDNTLSKMVLSHEIGDEIILKILSKGVTKEIKVRLEKMPNDL